MYGIFHIKYIHCHSILELHVCKLIADLQKIITEITHSIKVGK